MRECDELIYQRLIGDSGLVNLLQGEVARIGYGFQLQAEDNVPQLRFFQMAGIPGTLVGDFARTWEYTYEFGVWASNYVDIISRLKRLLDGYNFSVTGTAEVGAVRSVFDWDGPDQYDEVREVSRKDVRFRFFVVPKAQNPI